jgi:1,4-dihydroxy-2-naphthoyl-CoA hydrolase
MTLWFNKSLSVPKEVPLGPGTMAEELGMVWVDIGGDFMKIRMPVDHRTRQTYGILHGGASCALAETIGSIASHHVIDPEKFICLGMEINANHVRSASEGFVTATCTPLHIGASSHVWDIRIHDDRGRMVCICRFTVAILAKKNRTIG